MGDDIRYMDIKEFRDVGFLQEANRLFFHPLGLALDVNVDADGTWRLHGVQDYRDDPEGFLFANGVDQEKANRVSDERMRHWEARHALMGSHVQPVGFIPPPREEE